MLLLLALASCSNAAEKAKREYLMMKDSGASGQERCDKLQEIAAAYLSDEKETEYLIARIKADEQCLRIASQSGRY